MDELKQHIDIPNLIIKKINDDISPKEAESLNNWITKSEDNLRLFEKLSSDINLEDKRSTINKLNKNASWNKINKATQERKLQLRTRILRYAVAIALPIFLATSAYFTITLKKTTEIVKTEQQILPGTNKAKLILASGKTINLSHNKDILISEIPEAIVKSNNNQLVLTPKENNLEEKKIEFSTLSIPKGGEYSMVLPDGSKVWLNSDTKIRFPNIFPNKSRIVYLEGEAYFEVKHNKNKPFVVKTINSNVEVLGTKFNIKAYKEESKIYTTLAEGSVRFTGKNAENSCILKPNEQSVYDIDGEMLNKHHVYANTYTAWTRGRFAFENEKLEEILTQLGRWYDVEIFYLNQETKEYRFTGDLMRYNSISTILEMLEVTYNVKFKINKRSISVSKK